MSALGRVLTCGGLVAGGVLAAVALPGAAAPTLAVAAATALAGLANVLASDLHRALVDNGLDPLANHDLRRVVSQAISDTLRDVATRYGSLSLDRRRLRRIARITTRGWGALTNQHLFERIDERHAVEWFTQAGADSPREIRVLGPQDWQTLAEDLCRETLGWFSQPSLEAKAALAKALEESFFACAACSRTISKRADAPTPRSSSTTCTPRCARSGGSAISSKRSASSLACTNGSTRSRAS